MEFASQNGVKVALESFCYPPFIFWGLEDFNGFIKRFPPENFSVLLDAGHVHQVGFDLGEAVQMFGHRLLDVHVHDATREKDYRTATHLPIGKGTLSFPDLLDALREVGYDEWLTLEVRGTETEIVESRKHLERLVSEIRVV